MEASNRILASRNRRSKNVCVFPVVVAKLEFRDIERHVFGAHFVERAHHAAFEDRPEALHCTDDVLAFGVVNSCVRIFLVEFFVALPLIGAEQADFVRDRFAHEFTERISADVLDNAGDHVTLALDRADDRRRGRPHNCGADAVRSWRAPGGEAHQNGIAKSGHSDL